MHIFFSLIQDCNAFTLVRDDDDINMANKNKQKEVQNNNV